MDKVDELKEKALQAVAKLLNAKDEPAETCSSENGHDYRPIGHADGKDTYSWSFECNHCGDVYKETFERSEEDKQYWAD